MILKPQDVVILMKILLLHQRGQEWTYAGLAKDLHMSASEVHEGVKRATAARLIHMYRRVTHRKQFEEFLIHGVKYAYPPTRGGPTRGMLTGYAAPPMNQHIIQYGTALPPVWPDPNGASEGYEFSPLYKAAPKAASEDRALYELLTLVDCIRDGRAREVNIGSLELSKRICAIDSPIPE